jgi:hypothetical protein
VLIDLSFLSRRPLDTLLPLAINYNLPQACFYRGSYGKKSLGNEVPMVHSPEQVALLIPLLVAVALTLGTIVIHGLALVSAVHFVRGQRRRGVAGMSFSKDLLIVAAFIIVAFAAHVSEMALWALVLRLSGQFSDFAAAFYHSTENYTTLGYGDVVMSQNWKLLGPLEATTGMLMFGVSVAAIFAIIQFLFQARVGNLEAPT